VDGGPSIGFGRLRWEHLVRRCLRVRAPALRHLAHALGLYPTLPSGGGVCIVVDASVSSAADSMILQAENIPHRDLIREVAEHHGALSVRVFGSFARGDARPDSDLDLLVEAGPETSPWFPGGIVADLQEALGRRVDVVTLGGLAPELRDRVLQESVPV